MATQVTTQAQVPPRPWRGSLSRAMRRNGLQIGIVGVFLLLWIACIIGAPDTFLQPNIYGSLMQTLPYWGIIALPLTLVVIAGEIDLSFISITGVGMLSFWEVYSWSGNLYAGLAACLAAGFLAGLLNGVIVVYLGIPSLVATIGTQFFWRGFLNVALRGQGHSLVDTQGTLFRDLLVKKYFGYLPMQMFWMIVVAVLVWFILNRHRLGAHIYLVGDNENSARLMGINVGRTRMLAFALVGLAAAFGGLIQSVDVRYFWPNVGQGYLMVALAAVFLGGTSPFGGVGSVLGTFVGAMIIAWINPAIVAIGWTGVGWTELIYGLIITAAVAMHVVLRKRVI